MFRIRSSAIILRTEGRALIELIAKLAEKGVEVDLAVLRAVSEQAPRVAGEMNPQDMSNTLYAIAKLAEKGMKVDMAAVQVVSEQAPRVAGEMNPQNVAESDLSAAETDDAKQQLLFTSAEAHITKVRAADK